MEVTQRLLVLYGSQTGTSEEISERIAMQSRGSHFRCLVTAMDDYKIEDLVAEEIVIFICSTTGQGEPPDNMTKFWRFIMRKHLPSSCLSGVKFAVLGLGDSSYNKFNFVSKKLNRRLQSLGAEAISDVGLADDQHEWGCDSVVDQWIEHMWLKLIDIFPPASQQFCSPINFSALHPRFEVKFGETAANGLDLKESLSAEGGKLQNNTGGEQYNKNNPFVATVKSNHRMTNEQHFQETRLVTLDVSSASGDTSMRYEPGDVVMIRPRNLPHDVKEFLDLFSCNPDASMYFDPVYEELTCNLPRPVSLRHLAIHFLDFMSVPRRSFFQFLANLSEDENEREKLQEFATLQGTEARYDYVNRPRRTILEVLQDFHLTASRIPMSHLVDLVPFIRARAFSIASSPAQHRHEIHVLVAVVNYKTRLHRRRKGLCSSWMASLQVGDNVECWLKRGALTFKPNLPAIMIGPGTGISPFRSACHEFHARDDAKESAVFFGCRGSKMDFYFEEEWKELAPDVQLFTAFSRDQDEKVYVQDVIRKQKKMIWRMINDGGANVYLAGNSKNMPDGVRSAFLDIFAEEGGMSSEQSEAFYQYLQTHKRYQQETWC